MMTNVLLVVFTIVLLAISGCSTQSPAETATQPATADADNTAVNARDSSSSAQTPLDQEENQADIEISASIRKAIVADDSLSTNAHNVKIITAGGLVTLRGPVKSQQEKMTIETKAKAVAGVTKVDSFLEVEQSQ